MGACPRAVGCGDRLSELQEQGGSRPRARTRLGLLAGVVDAAVASGARVVELRVMVTYRPDDWAASPDGGRAPKRGLFVAELSGFRAGTGLGVTADEAIRALAADLIAHLDADGYPVAAQCDADDHGESMIVRLAREGLLVDALRSASEEPVLSEDPLEPAPE